jgi:tight adherence protein C
VHMSADPVLAAVLAGVSVLLIAVGAWLHEQSAVSATVLIVAQARGELGSARLRGRQATDALRRAVGRVAAALGPLGSSALKARLAWLGSGDTAEQFLARQILLAAAGLGVGLVLPAMAGYATLAALMAPLGAAVGWWLPLQELENRCRAVRRTLGREALAWADFLTAAVQAGLPLDGAIARLAAELPGRLPQVLARAVRQSNLTREPLDLCLTAAAAEIDQAHVSSVIGAIVQARQTGGDLAGPLSGLVGVLRQERQQELRTAVRGRSALGSLPLIFVMLPGVMVPLAYIVFAQFRAIGL